MSMDIAPSQAIMPVEKPPRPRRAPMRRPKRSPAKKTLTALEEAAIPTVTRGAERRSFMLWAIVGGITVLIIIVWGALFRWTMHDATKQNASAMNSAKDVRTELTRGLQEFQKNFSAVTALLNERFAAANTPSKDNTVTLSPEEIRALQERIDAVPDARTVQPLQPAPIDFHRASWPEFYSKEARIRLQYPRGWVPAQTSGERIAAFARPNTDGVALGSGILFVDVRPNQTNATLRTFYGAADRVHLYQAAADTTTVYVDGIRGVQFNGVTGAIPSTIVSVRHRARVIELTILGTDAESRKVLDVLLHTVHFE